MQDEDVLTIIKRKGMGFQKNRSKRRRKEKENVQKKDGKISKCSFVCVKF